MPGTRNIQIPVDLFNKITCFFEYVKLANYSFPDAYGLQKILLELQKKQRSINLHNNYTKMKQAKDDEQRRLAYSDYLKVKRGGSG